MVTSLVTIRLRWLWFIYFDHCDQINISDIKNIIGINAWYNLSIFLIQKLRFKLIYNYNSNTLIRIYLTYYIYVYFAYTTFLPYLSGFFLKMLLKLSLLTTLVIRMYPRYRTIPLILIPYLYLWWETIKSGMICCHIPK